MKRFRAQATGVTTRKGNDAKTDNNTRKVLYCLFMGLLILFSAPANQAAMEENSRAGQYHARFLGYSQTQDGRLAESAISNPKQSTIGMMAGAGLIGFVVMNAKRKK